MAGWVTGSVDLNMASPISAALKARIRRPSMLQKLCQPKDMLHHFPNGAYIGWSGFTGVGYPKYVTINKAHALLFGGELT